MLCREGKVALTAFSTFAIVTIYFLDSSSPYLIQIKNWKYLFAALLSGSVLTLSVPHPEVARRGAFIGTVFGTGCVLGSSPYSRAWTLLGVYLVILAIFHFSEYMLTAIYKQESLSIDSFLLNHSREYHVAICGSIMEFIIEAWLFPSFKDAFVLRCCSLVGLSLVIFGETCRKLAMITAKSNFSHNVQYKRIEGHNLVTNGIYSISRHPAYLGWFYWSIGTQAWLCNPLCLIGFAIASWKFFYERLEEEEFFLLKFFGEQYIEYMKKVPTRLPFNNGLESEIEKLCDMSH